MTQKLLLPIALVSVAIFFASYGGATTSREKPRPIRKDETKLLKDKIFTQFGILAEDKTDAHSPLVLRSFIFLLTHSHSTLRGLKTVRHLYAYYGHDSQVDIAAFHKEAHAISIGGISSYGDSDGEEVSISIIGALAHEMGHAFLLEKVSPRELWHLAKNSGDWDSLPKFSTSFDFMSEHFFSKHRGSWNRQPASDYSSTNLHEWFAEGFAAVILQELGKRKILGRGWREKLILESRKDYHYRIDYNQIPMGFSEWLKVKFK